MKRIFCLVTVLAALASGTNAVAGSFGAGHIVVCRVGDGTQPLTDTGNPIFLDEYTTAGIWSNAGGFTPPLPVQSIQMPTNWVGNNAPLIADGTAVAEGALSRSVDGRFLLVTGFGATLGQVTNTSLASTTTTGLVGQVARVVGLVDGFGRIYTTTAQTNANENGDDIRSAVSIDGTNIWLAGSSNGGKYTTRGSMLSTQVLETATNVRVLGISSNTLYFTANGRVGSATNPAALLPTTFVAGNFANLPGVLTTGQGSPFGFALFNLTGGSGPDTLYVCDNVTNTPGEPPNIAGAVLKYCYIPASNAWVSFGWISAQGATGVTGQKNGTNAVDLYITEGGAGTTNEINVLYPYHDVSGFAGSPQDNLDGGDANGNAEPLDPPGVNPSLINTRGIAFAPQGGDSGTISSGPGVISVGPPFGPYFRGPQGGPFLPSNYVFSVANLGSQSTNFAVTFAGGNWLTATPSSGTLASGASTRVTLSPNANAYSELGGFTYSGQVLFHMGSPIGAVVASPMATLNVLAFYVTPSTNFLSTGAVGGPFTPSSYVYTLTNATANALNWTVNLANSSSWASLSATTGSVAGFSTTNITITINGNANSLPIGVYADTLVFSNVSANTLADTRLVILQAGFGVFDDFRKYTQSANLVGQNNWFAPSPAMTSNPLQVSGGAVVQPGGCNPPGTTSQAADKNFNHSNITNTSTSTPWIYAGMLITVTSASASLPPNYTLSFYQSFGNGYSTGNLSMTDVGSSQFTFNCQVNNGAGIVQHGSVNRNYGQQYQVYLVVDAGDSNAFVYVNDGSYVFDGSNIFNNTYDATDQPAGFPAGYDPGMGSFHIGNYCNAVGQEGFTITKLAVSTNYADVYNFLAQVSTSNSWTNAASGKWETGGNWSFGVPSVADGVDLITNASTKTVTIDTTTSGSSSNSLTISNLTVSAPPGSINTLFLDNAGTATPLSILNALTIGTNGAVEVGNQSTVQAFSNLLVGVAGGTGALTIGTNGSTVFVTNAPGNAVLEVRSGTLSLTLGTVTVNQLVLTNGVNSVFTFNAGTLTSGGTFVTNNQLFAVGNGYEPATFHLNGGVHNFANGIEILLNAALTGCGTINGNVVIDAGGSVLADCGGALNFGGIVTNGGTMTAINGTTIKYYGPLVNDGSIVATNGGLQIYSTVINNGTVLAPTNVWIDGNGKWETPGNWLLGHPPSLNDSADFIANPGSNIVTIDATTTGSFPATMTVSNLLVSANTLSLTNAGTSVALRVLNLLTLTNSATLFVTNATLAVTNASHTAMFNLNSGTVTLLPGGTILADQLTNAFGNFDNLGGTLLVGGPANVDQGTQTVASGTTTMSSNLWVGSSVGSTGTVNVTGGTLTVTNSVFAVGNDGTLFGTGGVGHVTVSSGLVAAASILIGDQFGNDSSFRVTSNGHVRVTGGFRSNGIKTTLIDGGTLEIVDGPPPPFEDAALHDRIVVSYLGDGRLIVSNGTVLGLEMVVGLASGQGTFEMAGGSVNLSSNLLVGMTSTATGVVTITGGSISVTNGVFGVGNDGTVGSTGGVAHVAVSNGVVNAASILIGDSFGSDSSFAVSSNGHVVVHGGLRSNGIKTTTINGGTLEIVDGPPPPSEDPALHDRIVVSYLGDGRMIVSNGTVAGLEMVVGLASGQGTFEMAGGTVSLSSNLLVGMTSTATGVVTITGGSMYVTNGVFGVGNDGTLFGTGGVGQVTLSNGVVEAASVLVGDNFGSDSRFTVAGTGSVRAHGGLRSNGIKTTVVNGGTLEVVDGPAPVFEDPILFDSIVVSYLADGKMIVSNGTARTPGMLVGTSPGNTGTLELAGGTTSVFSNMTVGFVACTATGIVNVVGGNLFVTNATGNAVLEVRSGTFTVSSGLVEVDKLVVTSACARLVHTGGTLVYSQLVLNPNQSAVGDGIPNGWKQQYNLNPFDPNLGNEYATGNGFSNLQEYLAGFNPTNPEACLHIISVVKSNTNVIVTYLGANGDSTYVPGIASRTNVLEFTAGTASGGYASNNFASTGQTNILSGGTGTGIVTNMVDSGGATNAPSRYYRVRVLVP